MVNTSEAIAYAELGVYIPIFILTAIVVIRHGFQKQLGWIYLAVFCIIRVAGAGFKIVGISQTHFVPVLRCVLQFSCLFSTLKGLSFINSYLETPGILFESFSLPSFWHMLTLRFCRRVFITQRVRQTPNGLPFYSQWA